MNKLVLISVVAFAVGGAAGYALAPGKEVTKTVEAEKKTETERDKRKETIVVEIQKPDGTKEKTTRTVEDTKTTRNTESKEATTQAEKPVTRPQVSLAILAGSPVSFPPTPVYGGYISKEIIGPITVGAWGLSSGVVGLAVGLNF